MLRARQEHPGGSRWAGIELLPLIIENERLSKPVTERCSAQGLVGRSADSVTEGRDGKIIIFPVVGDG